MALEFKIKLEEFNRSVAKYPDNVYKHLRVANKRVGSEMEQEARSNHPTWTTRTGNLKDSIKYFYRSSKGKGVELSLKLLDEGSHPLGTKYGKWQHDGTTSEDGKVKLKGDPWVKRAFAKNVKNLVQEWQEAINKANKEF